MRFAILVTLTIMPALTWATELLKFDVELRTQSVCAANITCPEPNTVAENISVELGDQTVTTKHFEIKSGDFIFSVNIDISRNYIKPYGLRFTYDYCDAQFCHLGLHSMMGFILTDDLKNYSGSELLFAGSSQGNDSIKVTPSVLIKNLSLSKIVE